MKEITLATIKYATKQEIFDRVLAHARQQGRKSGHLDDSGRFQCLYRSPEGLKCFAGIFISDTEYTKTYEGKKWDRPKVFPKYHKMFIRTLQTIHDNFNVDQWEEKLEQFAKARKLIYTPKM